MDNQELVNDIVDRLREILPVVAKDHRFKFGAVQVESKLIPVVYLSKEEGIGYGIPQKYIVILKKADDLYAMRFEGFYDVSHFCVPAPWWPNLVSAEELDRLIIEIFEGWLRYCEEVHEYKKMFAGPDFTSLPL